MTTLYNYNRAYELSISSPVLNVDKPSVLNENEHQSLLIPMADFRTEYNVKTFTELHVEASISKQGKSSSGSNSNTTIKIYNASESSRNVICKVDNPVILKAGYNPEKKDKPELPIIYTGQIVAFRTYRKEQDIITELECKEAVTPTNKIRVGFYKKEGTYGDLIRHIKSVWENNGIKNSDDSVITNQNSGPLKTPDEIPLEGGYTFVGYLRQLTDAVCADVGYKWYIDNSILYIEPINTNEKITRYTFELNSNQVSLRDEQDSKRSSAGDKPKTGLRITSLLDGRFELGKYVKITDGDRQGTYKIMEVSHDLSFYGNQWTTTCVCEKEEE